MTERTMDNDGPIHQPVILTQPAGLEMIANLASEESEAITPNQVAAVIAAYHAMQEGDPLGAIRRDPQTGAVALRVEENGFHLWRINAPNGEHWNDTQPTLPWPKIG